MDAAAMDEVMMLCALYCAITVAEEHCRLQASTMVQSSRWELDVVDDKCKCCRTSRMWSSVLMLTTLSRTLTGKEWVV